MHVMDKNLDIITYAVSLIGKGVTSSWPRDFQTRVVSCPIREFLKRALCPILG